MTEAILNEEFLPDDIQELKQLYKQLNQSLNGLKEHHSSLLEEHTELQSALNIKSEELKKLSLSFINIREEERKHLSNEVHEELGQLAAAIKMDIDWLRVKNAYTEQATINRIEHAAVTADLLLKNIRRVASFLRPGMLDELGLNASLEWLCSEFAKIMNVPCVFEQLADDHDIPTNVKTHLYRICEEALTNISLHTLVSYVSITIRKETESLKLCITDDGKGFDPAERTDGIGLIVMRERANLIGSELSIDTSFDGGTQICVTVPL